MGSRTRNVVLETHHILAKTYKLCWQRQSELITSKTQLTVLLLAVINVKSWYGLLTAVARNAWHASPIARNVAQNDWLDTIASVTPYIASLVLSYIPGWREPVWVYMYCPRTQHDVPAKTQTWTARSRVERTNLEAPRISRSRTIQLRNWLQCYPVYSILHLTNSRSYSSYDFLSAGERRFKHKHSHTPEPVMIWTGAQGLVYGSSRDPLQTYNKRKVRCVSTNVIKLWTSSLGKWGIKQKQEMERLGVFWRGKLCELNWLNVFFYSISHLSRILQVY